LKSLTGSVDASGNVVLFGATTDTAANFLYGFKDTLSNTSSANVVSNQLVAASTAFTGSAWNLRGVALAVTVPEPASIGVIAVGGLLLARRRK